MDGKGRNLKISRASLLGNVSREKSSEEIFVGEEREKRKRSDGSNYRSLVKDVDGGLSFEEAVEKLNINSRQIAGLKGLYARYHGKGK